MHVLFASMLLLSTAHAESYNFFMSNVTATSAILTWINPPKHFIEELQVRCIGVQKHSHTSSADNGCNGNLACDNAIDEHSITRFTHKTGMSLVPLGELLPNYMYNCFVTFRESNSQGHTFIKFRTKLRNNTSTGSGGRNDNENENDGAFMLNINGSDSLESMSSITLAYGMNEQEAPTNHERSCRSAGEVFRKLFSNDALYHFFHANSHLICFTCVSFILNYALVYCVAKPRTI